LAVASRCHVPKCHTAWTSEQRRTGGHAGPHQADNLRRTWRVIGEGNAPRRRTGRYRCKLRVEGETLPSRQGRWQGEPADSETSSCDRRQIERQIGASTVRQFDALCAALSHDHISIRQRGRSNRHTRLCPGSRDGDHQRRIASVTYYRQAAAYGSRRCRSKLNLYGAALAHRDRPGRISADHRETGARQGRPRNGRRPQPCIGHAQALRRGVPNCDAAEAQARHARRKHSYTWIGRLRFRRAGVARAT